MKRFALSVIALFMWSGSGWAATTVDAANHFAYGANVGWLEARGDLTNGTVIGQSYCRGYLWSANCGWVCLGNMPTNGWRYSNSSVVDWGVNHDGEGTLTGFAYGANIGWVIFEQTHGRPRFDLRTGNLSGYVYAANVGWISLSNAQARVQSLQAAGPDTDADGLPDAWEYQLTNDLSVLSGLVDHDADGDGATDVQEYGANTNPFNAEDRLTIVGMSVDGPTNTIQWTANASRLYRLEGADAMNGRGAVWMDAGGGLIGPLMGPSTVKVVNATTQTTRFYRVKADIPLPE